MHVPLCLLAALALLLPAPARAEGAALSAATPLAVLGFVAVIAWGLGRYAASLRADFVRLAADAPPSERLAAFQNAPAGLPEGSVRASLAVAIVLLCLPALVLSQALGLGGTGELGTILGGVIGFYLGSRGAGDGERTRRAEPAAAPAAPPTRAAAVLEAAAQAAPAVEAVFRQPSPASIAAALAAASQAVDEAGEEAGFPPQLRQVLRTAQAATEAAAAVDALDSPEAGLGAALGPVLRAFAAVPLLGASPAGLAGGLLLGAWQAAAVGRAHHARWMARVLDRPVPPEALPAGAWDGEAARALLAESPVLAAALADRIAPDAPQDAAATALARLLEEDGAAWLRAEHPGLGAEAEAAVAAMRRRVLDGLLDQTDVRPAGGLEQPALRAALDRLREGGAGSAVQALGRLAEGLSGSGPDFPAAVARALVEAEGVR
jgi:hypothetical protein